MITGNLGGLKGGLTFCLVYYSAHGDFSLYFYAAAVAAPSCKFSSPSTTHLFVSPSSLLGLTGILRYLASVSSICYRYATKEPGKVLLAVFSLHFVDFSISFILLFRCSIGWGGEGQEAEKEKKGELFA